VRRTVLAAIITALVCPAASSLAVTDDTGLGIRIVDAPVARQDDPRAKVYIVDHVAPGATISRRLEVVNGTPTARHVDLYADAAAVADGAFTPAAGRTESDLTTWTTIEPTSLELKAQGKAFIRVTIAVPKDASPGERFGVVFAELPAAQGTGLKLASRVGIRTYLSVGPGGEPASDFTIDTLAAERDASGAPVVKALVKNTGGRALDMSGSLKLSNGPGSLTAGPFAAELGSTLKPGDTEPVKVKLDKALPAGPWDARLDLQSGLLKRAATATITFPSGAGIVATPVKAKSVPLTKNEKVLVPVAAGLVLLVLLALGAMWWWRRRRERSGPGGGVSAAAPPGSLTPS
jgi:hypothetical protein